MTEPYRQRMAKVRAEKVVLIGALSHWVEKAARHGETGPDTRGAGVAVSHGEKEWSVDCDQGLEG